MLKRFFRLVFYLTVSYLAVVYLFAILSCPSLIGQDSLPAHLKLKKHGDYTMPGTKWIPFSVTAWSIVEPPIMLLGNQTQKATSLQNQTGPSPIPEPGTWQLSAIQLKKSWPLFLPYFALTTKSGWHFRISCRWDDIDHYYVFPSLSARYLKEYRQKKLIK
ncbi:MAG: hypothetical protein Q7S32_02625 [bacterium]|nr:hypothetical protein [bacterium]